MPVTENDSPFRRSILNQYRVNEAGRPDLQKHKINELRTVFVSAAGVKVCLGGFLGFTQGWRFKYAQIWQKSPVISSSMRILC